MALEINVLGPLRIVSSRHRLGRFPKKARVLLAYLATRQGQAVSRDRLVSLLWPNQSSAQGRHSLRNCLLELRRALGENATQYLVADYTECSARDASVDLEHFERLSGSADRSEWRAAAELYRGDFLADVHLASEPCEAWLAVERARTRTLVCGVLERLATEQLTAQEPDQAVQSARRLVTLDPLSEPSHRLLMRAYLNAGQRPQALRQYECCIEILSRELGIAPDIETTKLAREIASSGGVTEVPSSRVYVMPEPRLAVQSGSRNHFSTAQGFRARAEPLPKKARARWECLLPNIAVAITPLRNLTGDADQQDLVEALSDDLVTDLIRRGNGLSFSRAQNRRQCADLGTEYMVSGSVQPGDGRSLRVTIRIADLAEYRWVGQYILCRTKFRSHTSIITGNISGDLHILLLAAASRRAFKASEAPVAADDCLSRAANALDALPQAELTAIAQRWFLAALADDPCNVEALVGVARTCQHIIGQPWWADSREIAVAADLGCAAVTRALSLAPGRALAQCIKGMLCSETGQVEEAVDLFAGALAADPRLGIAEAFGGYNAAFLGHAEATLPAVERAMQLDHTQRRQSIFYFFGGFGELLLGRTETAIALLDKSLKPNPSYGSARLFRAAALLLVGRQHEAIRAVESFRERYPNYRSSALEKLWLSRSTYTTYRTQITSLFETMRALGAID